MVKDIEKSILFFNNKWKAVELIGEGSYGKVYKAVKEEFGVKAYSAIKQIEIPYSKSEINTLRTEGMTEVDIGQYFEKSVKQWIEEIEVLLIPEIKECENIVNIEDYEVVKKQNEIGWTINIRMEELTSLDKYEIDHKFTDKDILKIGIDVASALEVCESKNIVHRDIKPENIFVNGRGVYKVGDFGVAKHVDKTISNMSKKGTENYMAPELYQKKRGNKTVDIYSLGIMLYRYFNYNRLPFLPDYPEKITPNDREEAIYKRISGEEKMPPPINASREIAEVILKACDYYPKERYQSAKEIKDKLINIYSNIYDAKELTPVDNDIIKVPPVKDVTETPQYGNKPNVDNTPQVGNEGIDKEPKKEHNTKPIDNTKFLKKIPKEQKNILIFAIIIGIIFSIGDSHKSIPAIIYSFASFVLMIEAIYNFYLFILKKINVKYHNKSLKIVIAVISFIILEIIYSFLSNKIGIWKWIIINFE